MGTPHHSERSCYCRCHVDELGHGRGGVPRAEALAAAVACARCRDFHCPALSGPAREPRRRPPPPDPTAYQDPPSD
jgi:hypothetical protein